ncbi:MAG: hypothetical protein ABIJ74_03910 [archaeon]
MKKEAQILMKKLKKNNLELTSEEQSKLFDVIDELEHTGYIQYVNAKDENKIALSLTPLGEEYADRELEKNKLIDKKTITAFVLGIITSVLIIVATPMIEVLTNNAVLDLSDPSSGIIEIEYQRLEKVPADSFEICFRNIGKADSGKVYFTIIKDGLYSNYGNPPDLKAGEKQECAFVSLRVNQTCINDGNCFEELTKNNNAIIEMNCSGCKPQKREIPITFCVWKNSPEEDCK